MAKEPEGKHPPHWISTKGLSKERVAVFGAKAILFQHQVNILREVHGKRELWGSQVVAGFEEWARSSVRTWVEEDEDLMAIWRLFRKGQGPADPFVQWLEGLLPR